jgi:haloalkane dehalogenase
MVNRWLDHLGVDRATLVIHDLGGAVGIATVADRFERSDSESFTGVVAVNTFAWPPRSTGLRAMLGFMGRGSPRRSSAAPHWCPRLTRTGFGVGRRLDSADRRAFLGPYRDSPQPGRNFHRAMASAARSERFLTRADTSLRTTLRHLPVLTVFGERNDPFGFGRQWKARFPDARQEIISGGNHFPMCDDPAMVAGWIRSWHRDLAAPHTVSTTK